MLPEQDILEPAEIVYSVNPTNGLPNPYECRLVALRLAEMDTGPMAEPSDTRWETMRVEFDHMLYCRSRGDFKGAQDAARMVLVYLYNEPF